MSDLESHIKQTFGLNSNLSQVGELFKEESLAKGEFFLKRDTFCKKMSFIDSGYLRISRWNDNKEKEITQWISSPKEMITDLASFMFNQPARWDIEALTDCKLYTISSSNYELLNTIIPNWKEIEQLFISHCFITLEERVHQLISDSAEERFNLFYRDKKELFNQVPLQYLASMLGMTPETLSRIRSKGTS